MAETNASIFNKIFEYNSAFQDLIFNGMKRSNQISKCIFKENKKWEHAKLNYQYYIQNPDIAIKNNINVDSLYKILENTEQEFCSLRLPDIHFDTLRLIPQDVYSGLKDDEAYVKIIRVSEFDNLMQSVNANYSALVFKKNPSNLVKLVKIGNSNELDSVCFNKYYNLVNSKNINVSDSNRIILPELYNKLWKRISDEVGCTKKIYLSNDGVYSLINVNTLINPTTGNYLLDENEIQFINSFKDILKKDELKTIQNNTVCVFGNPDLSKVNSNNNYFIKNIKFNSLKDGEEEILKVSNLFKQSDWKVEEYQKQDATEENIRQIHSPGIFHITTHGYYIENPQLFIDSATIISMPESLNQPMDKALLLLASHISDKNTDSLSIENDGIFSARDAMKLDLEKTGLVFLSACQTGKGLLRYGDGITGMQRAFFIAGAKSVIYSLWDIKDRASKNFTINFYTNLFAGQNRSQAFRNGLISIKSKFPYFQIWGPLMYIGS